MKSLFKMKTGTLKIITDTIFLELEEASRREEVWMKAGELI